MSQNLNEKVTEPPFDLISNAKKRGASDFRADYQLLNNPYSLNSKDYFEWARGFLEANQESNK